MSRQPTVGGDVGAWGTILNDYLSQGIGSDGTLKAITAINVKDPAYGAKGDGITDDTAAINSAITAAEAGASGQGSGTVYFPSGVYLTDGFTITGRAIHLIGQAQGAPALTTGVSLKCRSSTTNFITISGIGHVFENLYFNGNNLATNTVRITNICTYNVFNNIVIDGAVNSGVNLNLTPITPNTQVSDLYFYNLIVNGRSGGANITDILINSTQSQNLRFYNLVAAGATNTDVDYAVKVTQGDFFSVAGFYTKHAIADILLTAGNMTLVANRSETTSPSTAMVQVDGTGTVVLENFTAAGNATDVALQINTTFTGKALLLGGLYSTITNNSTVGYTRVQINRTAGALDNGTSGTVYTEILPTTLNLFGATGDNTITMRNTTGAGNATIRWQSSGGTNQAGISSNFNFGDAGNLEFLGGNATRGRIGSAGGLVWGAATGGDKGVGTINIQGSYYSSGSSGVTKANVSSTFTNMVITGGLITAITT